MPFAIGFLVAGLLVGAGTGRAQEVGRAVSLVTATAERDTIIPKKPDPATVVLNDSDLETMAKELIAARWRVDGSGLVVEWGAYSGDEPDPGAGVELMGSGSGGYWVVRFKLKSGGLASVRARAGLLTRQPVASQRLQRGQVLTHEDMAVSTKVVWGAPRPSGPAPSEGWITQRVITAGERLRIPAVRPPMAVVTGSVVELIWDKGAIGLRLPGTAAGSAALGDMVFVRTESGRRLRGVAVAPGTVNVTGGGTR